MPRPARASVNADGGLPGVGLDPGACGAMGRPHLVAARCLHLV